MKPTRQQKVVAAQDWGQALRKAQNLYLTQYQGLRFTELQQLRAKLRPLSCRYTVVKNSLVRNALREAGIPPAAGDLLKGPIGLVVGEGVDPVAAARALAAFAREYPLLKFRAGYVEGQWLDAQGCVRLAALGTRSEVLTALAGVLYSTVSQAAGVLQAPIRDMILVLRALEEKRKDGAAPAVA